MNSIWSLLSSYEDKYKIDPGRCRFIISQSDSIKDVRNYIENVQSRLEQGDRQAIEEAWSVAIPLAYRLAIDDTASGYRIASKIRETSIWLDQPEIMLSISGEIEWIFKSSCGIGYSELKSIQENIDVNLVNFSKTLQGEWRVYSRLKSISSILSKFSKMYFGEKLPKNRNYEVLEKIKPFLVQFQDQVSQRLLGNYTSLKSYDPSIIKWLLPDLLAFTLQLKEDINSTQNLGSAKARYKSVYKKLENFPGRLFYGPSYSKAWHMNRMVCYLEWEVDLFSCIAFELFVRTDLDYFIGYGNYWRYKGVELFKSPSREKNTYQRKLIKEIRACRNFSEVQTIVFSEVTTGQLDLF